MAKKTLTDLTNLKGKKVLIRVDFNVPQDDAGNISNDRRIRSALPTIQHVLNADGSAIVMSHFGRPKGDPKKDAPFTMNKIAARLSELLGKPVKKMDAVVGAEVKAAVQNVGPGEVILLENLRFHAGEQKGDEAFAKEIAALGDVYVNDAFGTCHRTDASMYAVPAALAIKPRVVGFLVAKELEILGQLLSKPPRPLIGVMGGAKVSDKMGFIKSMLKRVDKLLIGGAMTYTFMLAKGQTIGSSKAEADKVDLAKELLALGGDKIVLPVDHLTVDKPDASAKTTVVEGQIPAGSFGMDIGPKTIALYCDLIRTAGTVVWNGPLGKFEDEPFSKGTKAVAHAMTECKGVTIVGGGETAEAVEAFGLDSKMTHVSTGGGAFLEYVEGTPFKALSVIDDK
ncbi:MAG: phosphoglycerate kinase [Gemmatales bacterium]